MSTFGMRHTSGLPAGFTFPPSIASDSWADRTVILPAHVLRQALEAKQRQPFKPAWDYTASGMEAPTAARVQEWAKAACSYRSPARGAYARAWLLFCATGGMEAPTPATHGLTPLEARHIQRRFMDLELFDPRDFAGVPF